jgi:hypothetical protein
VCGIGRLCVRCAMTFIFCEMGVKRITHDKQD